MGRVRELGCEQLSGDVNARLTKPTPGLSGEPNAVSEALSSGLPGRGLPCAGFSTINIRAEGLLGLVPCSLHL